jgi:hypothetical protein
MHQCEALQGVDVITATGNVPARRDSWRDSLFFSGATA